MNDTKLKKYLEKLYAIYNKKAYVHPDPLEFLYAYEDIKDREIVGLIASALAYGNVKQIIKSVSKALEPIQPSPNAFLQNASYNMLEKTYENFKHRFTDGKNLAALLFRIKNIIKEFGSLNECFCKGIEQNKNFLNNKDFPIMAGISFLAYNLNKEKNKPKHLIPIPEKQSACKRINLFLRWMIRKDRVDPGGWQGVLPSDLIIPLDTHMQKISYLLGFTKRKTANIKTALEITSAFRKINSQDPTKYDFCLTRFGIRDDMSVKDLNLIVQGSYPDF